MATLYRHFATKAALRDAVFAGRMQRLADRVDHAAHGSDPGRAFFEFFAGIVGEDTTSDPLTRTGQEAEAAATRLGHPLHTALGHLLDRAQRCGQVRGDVDTAAVVAVMVGTVHALRQAGSDTHLRALALTVAVDGLSGARSSRPERPFRMRIDRR